MTAFLASSWWNDPAWASYVDLPDPATAVQDEPALVGYVTIEFDVRGEVMGDGQLYPDNGTAADIAARRNAAEGNPEDLTDRWFVAAVIAELPDAAAAVRHAAVRRRDGDTRSSDGTVAERAEPDRAHQVRRHPDPEIGAP